MNPTLLKIAQFIAKRPSDKNISLIHIISGVIVIACLWFARDLSVMDIPFMRVYTGEESYIFEYVFMSIGVFLILRGILRSGIVKQKTLRILQALAGLALIIIGGPIMDPIVTSFTPQNTNTNGFIVDALPIPAYSWHPGIILILLGIVWIMIGLTGKGTLSKNIHFGEIVKKIRV